MDLIASELRSNYIDNNENSLIKGSLEKFDFSALKVYSSKEVINAEETFSSISMEYNYVNGECHNKAHLGGLCLINSGYSIFKIWNFSPSIYSHMSQKTLKVNDPLNLHDYILTDYHVAIAVLCFVDGIKTVKVIDPTFSKKSMSIKDWRDFQNCPNALFTFTEHKKYLFNTMNGFNIYNNENESFESLQLPSWFPKIITGDFFEYNGFAKESKWIPKGLASLDVAIDIYNKTQKGQISSSYVDIIKDINQFRNKLEEKQIGISFINYWNERIEHWNQKLMVYG